MDSEWIVCEGSVVYLPVQETVDQTRTIRNDVERPHPVSFIEPLPYRCFRYQFVFRLLGDETLESIQDAEINLERHRTAQAQFSDIMLGRCIARQQCFHAFTPVGISRATARKSSVASFR